MSSLRDHRPVLCMLLFAVLTGCDNHLETGYKYRPLNSTGDDRRAYYAPAFTPESHVDKKGEKDSDPGQ